MVFASIEFIYYFLPIFLVCYLVTPKRGKNLVLLLFSLFFYAFGEPLYIGLMIFSSIVDYTHGRLIEARRGTKPIKWILVSSILINVGLLATFKYLDFAISGWNVLFHTSIETTGYPLPIGISFYTFQTMSYTIDVYKGKIKAQRNFIHFATYVSMFPQLIAGPIVRYVDVEESLEHRKVSSTDFSEGVVRFVQGLAKKVLLADTFGALAVQIMSVSEQSVLLLWLYVIAYGFQIYFDFSGYSDMAIGLGRMIGFHFPENFNYPYTATSVTDFWRRWHMTLSRWFKDYLYIPLGGSRTSKAKWLRNIMIVWAVTGLWHGAAWNFVFWGLYFGLFLVLEKTVLSKVLEKLPRLLKHLYTLLVVFLGWVFFSIPSIADGFLVLKSLFGLQGLSFSSALTTYYLGEMSILLPLGILFSTPFVSTLRKDQERNYLVWIPVTVVLMILVTGYLINSEFHPFLYFRF